MDLVLLAITIGALGLAVGLAIVGWKLLHQDHADTNARADHLRALAMLPDADAHDVHLDAIAMLTTPTPVRDAGDAVPVPVLARLTTFGHDDSDEPEVDWDATLGHGLPTEPMGAQIFGSSTVAPAPSRRLALVGAVAVVMLGSVGTAYAVYRPQLSSVDRSSADARVPANVIPLDLLSLNEATDADGTFTVTGLVGNPSSGRTADRVMAVVYLFDRDGHYFATGRAGIDLASLTPGDQSPFVVKVAHGSGAARYRVGFRQLDGAAVAHVDKRAQALDGTMEAASPTIKGSGQ